MGSQSSFKVTDRVGQYVNVAVERLVTVGETIASDSSELREDMYRACNQARTAGCNLEKLCEVETEEFIKDGNALAQAAKFLLASVTKVLLLADVIIVKQLLCSRDKVSRCIGRLDGVTNFSEFSKAFSQFGTDMVEFAHLLTNERRNETKDNRRKAQMSSARQILDRSAVLLVTSSKTCMRHPDSSSCQENRDTVFCQMRRAVDLIHFVIKDCAFHGEINEQWDDNNTVFSAIQQFESLVEITRLTYNIHQTKESLTNALDTIIERTQDFTDSAYISQKNRENIILLCNRVRIQLNTLFRAGVCLERTESYSPTDELECTIKSCLSSSRDLHNQLINTTHEVTSDLPSLTRTGSQLVSSILNAALACDEVKTQQNSQLFTQHISHFVEMCKLLKHIAHTETLQFSAQYAEINIRIYGPQVCLAATTLYQHPSSEIAKENLEGFADMWLYLMNDVTFICKAIMQPSSQLRQTYMSLPRPGPTWDEEQEVKEPTLPTEKVKYGTCRSRGGVEEQEKMTKAGLEMKQATSEVDAETDRWQEGSGVDKNNDIVKRTRTMSRMAFSMYQFTKGTGPLKTTQDLFTQAEYFAEEANRLYKIVPSGSDKIELLELLDRVPKHVQQLQFLVKNPTVGKIATFVKADTVIHETKNLMNAISKAITTCFLCVNKYNLDLQGIGWNGSGEGGGGGEGGSRAGGDGSKGGSSSSSDPGI